VFAPQIGRTISVNQRYDAIVIGAGPAGEVAASRLPKLGLRAALVERELVGGECAYWWLGNVPRRSATSNGSPGASETRIRRGGRSPVRRPA
jgi:cation diffusion facilitator CzcD-associated flavoprotein CzcO